jgi:regulator of replication initiation timing
MDSELSGLEHTLAALLADYNRLRAENDSMKRELGRALEHNRALNARIQAATTRLDSLLRQLPESTP